METKIKEEVVNTTEEKEETTKTLVDLDSYRKPIYAKKVTLVGVEVRVKDKKTQVVLIDSEGKEYTHKLTKKTESKTFSTALGMDIKVSETEKVDKTELMEFMPEIFKLISAEIKEKGSIEVVISYMQSALEFESGLVIYNSLRDYHVKTIYAPSLHNDKERLEKQLDYQKKSEDRKKGEVVDI